MTVCQNVFKLRTKEVSKVLKNLQVITRYIQNICNYTKVSCYFIMIFTTFNNTVTFY